MTTFKAKLFYSYCHADTSHRKDMQKFLILLRKKGVIDEWHDEELIPGQQFGPKIKEKLEEANIVVFLMSQNFVASDPCMEEWNIAKEQADRTGQKLIPIIVEECTWRDFDDMKTYLALPKDGKPVISWDDKNKAWQSVYEGIKKAVEDTRNTFSLKSKFKKEISSVEFISLEKIISSWKIYSYSRISLQIQKKMIRL